MKSQLVVLCSVLLLIASSTAIAASDCSYSGNYDRCVRVTNCDDHEIHVCAYDYNDDIYLIAADEANIGANDSGWVQCGKGPCKLKVGKSSCSHLQDGTFIQQVVYKDGKILDHPLCSE